MNSESESGSETESESIKEEGVVEEESTVFYTLYLIDEEGEEDIPIAQYEEEDECELAESILDAEFAAFTELGYGLKTMDKMEYYTKRENEETVVMGEGSSIREMVYGEDIEQFELKTAEYLDIDVKIYRVLRKKLLPSV